MNRLRPVAIGCVAALVFAVLPAAAGSNDWGTWTHSGSGKSWSGTFSDTHTVTGFVVGTKSLVKYNSVVSFTIGGKTCNTSKPRGTGYCYYVNIPPNKQLTWKVQLRRRAKSWAAIVPCIQYGGSFHCRYGNN